MKFCPECGIKIQQKDLKTSKHFKCTGNNCDYVQWNNPIPVVAALVKHNKKYIIARNAQWPKKIFSLITGFLESGEEIENAIIREVKEELGLTGKISNYLGHYSFFEQNQIIIAFEVEAVGSLKVDNELAEVKYLTKEELKEYNFHPLYITEKIILNWLKSNRQNV